MGGGRIHSVFFALGAVFALSGGSASKVGCGCSGSLACEQVDTKLGRKGASKQSSPPVTMAASGFLKASVFLALAIGAAAQFPCEPVPPCADDPTFLLFGFFPCGVPGPDPCAVPDGAAACALQCLTCVICEDPDPIPGIISIFQYELFGDSLIVYLDSSVTVAGFQAQLGCVIGGE